MRTRIFVLDVDGVDPESLHDTKEVLIESDYHPEDITSSTFTNNYDGLPGGCIFAVPGGNVSEITKQLDKKTFVTISELINQHRQHYLGISAGMIMASNKRRASGDFCFIQPKNFGLLKQPVYTAFADVRHKDRQKQDRRFLYAYNASIFYLDTKESIFQLYLNGAGVCLNDAAETDSRMLNAVAYYKDVNDTFKFPQQSQLCDATRSEEMANPAAIVRSYATASKGSFLLFGTHVEASVNRSEVAKALMSGALGENISFFKGDVPKYRDDRNATLALTTALIKQTFI